MVFQKCLGHASVDASRPAGLLLLNYSAAISFRPNYKLYCLAFLACESLKHPTGVYEASYMPTSREIPSDLSERRNQGLAGGMSELDR
jgi:hypothetical protein